MTTGGTGCRGAVMASSARLILMMLVLVVALCPFPACGATTQPAAPASFPDFDRRARQGASMSVVFFGGSLTWGANASDPQLTSYRARMSQYLQARYPKASFKFFDAAIGGTGSMLGMFRIQRDVLAHHPDLVFLDFTANDDLYTRDLPTLASYESLVREMVEQSVLVEQVFLGFKFNFGPDWSAQGLPRVIAHKEIAKAYHTAIGDCFPLVQKRLEDGSATLDGLWPFDRAHPDDSGYELFFVAARDGFEQAVADGRACAAPAKPVFSGQYSKRERIHLAQQHDLPAGWKITKTYRTSMWFDGLSSRWMDDVVVCDASDRASIAPLMMAFTGTFVGVLGEADKDGLSFTASVDGQPLMCRDGETSTDRWTWSTATIGGGRLLLWRKLTDSLPPGQHILLIQPVLPAGKADGQLRIESICVAGQ